MKQAGVKESRRAIFSMLVFYESLDTLELKAGQL